MNFTREPIIETIISPKDGCKLVVRNSKGGGQEEYYVDALEVVSFGHSFFFRSLERPKSFLVPVSDYEVVEVKETRVVLKNAGVERSIKIGGGREASIKAPREPVEKIIETSVEKEEVDEEVVSSRPVENVNDQRNDKKRDRRRHRRRRGPDDRQDQQQREWGDKSKPAEEEFKPAETQAAHAAEQGGGAHDETQVSSSMFSSLFPPPSTLISDTISRYKDLAVSEGNVFPKPLEQPSMKKADDDFVFEDDQEPNEESKERKKDKEENKEHKHDHEDNADSTYLSRISTNETYETQFSSLPETRFFF